MKILHLPTNTGGMAWELSRGERQLGLLSDVLILERNWLDYPADKVLFKEKCDCISGKAFKLYTLIKEVFKSRNKYDVFHFNYGTSLLDFNIPGLPSLLDLPFYKNKRIIVTYNGCDARQKYSTMKRVPFSACHELNCYNGICTSGELDGWKKEKIIKFDHYASSIFAVNPDLLYFLPKRAGFLPYTIANWDKIKLTPYHDPTKKIRIVHAPTNRAAKGSNIIINALEKIKKNYGNMIEIILVENVSHEKALQIYTSADLIIDQILIGWYGGFAVEAMKMGKPVMTFIRMDDLKFIPKEMARDCQRAIINVDPDTLYKSLCDVMDNPHVLKQYREAALDYVYKWHDPLFVAGITKSAYET